MAEPESLFDRPKIRLTVLVSTLTIGGAEQLLIDLLAGINRERFDVFICFLKSPGIMGAELIRSGFPAKSNILKGRFDPFAIFKISRILASRQTDIVLLINHRDALFYGIPAAKIARVGVVVNWANEAYKKYSSHALTMAARKILHRGVNKVVAAASGHKDYLVSVEGIPGKKIEVIYNGVDVARCRSDLSAPEARKRMAIPAQNLVVSMIAALRPDKAQDVFLKAAKTVMSSFPDAHYLVVGDGSRKEMLMRMAIDLGIDAQTHFLGFRRDINDILAGVDVNVLATRPHQETLSVAVIEAMAAGVPVICTDVGFMREIIDHGKTGFLVALDNQDDLAENILMLLRDPNLRKKIAQRAQALVFEKLTKERMTLSLRNFF